MEIYGRTSKIQTVSRGANVVPALQPTIPNDEYSSRFDALNEAIGDLCNLTNEDTTMFSKPLRTGLKNLAEPESSDPEDMDPDGQDLDFMDDVVNIVHEVEVHAVPKEFSSEPSDQPPVIPTGFPLIENVRKRAFTFHDIHGENIKLLGSDTVALRVQGYDHGISVVSMPLKRGESCWFRIDKVDPQYSGTISIGAIPYLPIDALPPKALDLPIPAWILASEHTLNKHLSFSTDGAKLESLGEGQAISVRFEQNGDVVIEIDRKQGIYRSPKTLSVLGHVRDYTEIYPLIDVYGKVIQVSTIIHPYYVVQNKKLQTSPVHRHWRTLIDPSIITNLARRGLWFPAESPPCIYFQPPIPAPQYLCDLAKDLGIEMIINDKKEVHLVEQKHLSMQSLSKLLDEIQEQAPVTAPKISPNLDENNIGDDEPLGEANDDDQLDSEIISALTMEVKDLPDLSEEQVPSFDLWPQLPRTVSLCAENLNYLKRILYPSQEGAESSSLESEWETGDGCEHLHTVLKYWMESGRTYPELRRAVSWGQIKCYCSKCEPGKSSLSGWVRIERIDGVGAASKGYYHLTKMILGSAQNARAGAGGVKRPSALVRAPNNNMPSFDLWINDEGTPFVITVAIEIDIEGSNADNDRLLAILLYLRAPASPDDSRNA